MNGTNKQIHLLNTLKGLTVAEVVAIELEAAVPTTEDLTSKVTIHVK